MRSHSGAHGAAFPFRNNNNKKLQSHNAARLGQNFFVDVGREGVGRKEMSTGLLSDITD